MLVGLQPRASPRCPHLCPHPPGGRCTLWQVGVGVSHTSSHTHLEAVAHHGANAHVVLANACAEHQRVDGTAEHGEVRADVFPDAVHKHLERQLRALAAAIRSGDNAAHVVVTAQAKQTCRECVWEPQRFFTGGGGDVGAAAAVIISRLVVGLVAE
eukprot:59719-Chlamydomonas_euryale.AAC.1